MTRARSLSLLANANAFTISGSNNVGIGSTIPDVKLDVGGDLYADNLTINNLIGVAATFSGVVSYEDVTNVDSVGIITAQSYVSIADSIVHTGDIDTAIRFPEADTFTVETAGTEALRVDSNGKLLLGTNTSQGHPSGNLLEIGNYTVANAGITINNPTDGAGVILFGDSSSTNRRGRIEYTHVSDAFRFYTADAERLRITSTGNIGINSTNPAYPLDIAGTSASMRLNSTNSSTLVITSGASNAARIEFGDLANNDTG